MDEEDFEGDSSEEGNEGEEYGEDEEYGGDCFGVCLQTLQPTR